MATMTEITTTVRQIESDLPEHEGLHITRYPEHDVAIVDDGQVSWAGRIAELDAALDKERTYRVDERGWVGGADPLKAAGYTDLCQDVTPLSAEDPGVTEACAEHGIDTDVLQA